MTRDDTQEQLDSLSEYYSEVTGRYIEISMNYDSEIFIKSNRTNGNEFCETIEDAEDRIKRLYSECFGDDNEIEEGIQI